MCDVSSQSYVGGRPVIGFLLTWSLLRNLLSRCHGWTPTGPKPSWYDKLTDERLEERSEAIRVRVERARETQRQRFADMSLSCNTDMGPTEVRKICRLDEIGRGLVKAAVLAGASEVIHHGDWMRS
jgi:hypothetical protein